VELPGKAGATPPVVSKPPGQVSAALPSADKQVSRFRRVLEEYPAVLNEEKLLPVPGHHVEHRIETSGHASAARYRRLDPAKLQAAKREFEEMEQQGIVRRSSSHWASPLHMVRKSDGTWRPCGDFRLLNDATVPDRYTSPNLADLTARLEGCTIFSKLDLRKGYLQVPVAKEDVAKTAVITPFGLFEFLRMPFGLRNAAQTFQRMMDEVLSGLPWVFVYLDDVLVASRSEDEHEQHLREVLAQLQQHGLVLNGEKCVLGVNKVEYLGHQVSATGVMLLPDKVTAIAAFPRPANTKSLLNFLGMINFYRRFIPGAAGMLKPLTDSTRGERKKELQWTQEMVAAFEAAKQCLLRVAELAHPVEGAELALAVDASDTHVGAVLQQRARSGTSLRPLGFFSKKLSPAQEKYSAFDRELLAVVLAIRHFKWAVEGQKFYVLTDHKPLTQAVHRLSEAWTSRQQSHLSFVVEFTSDVRHVAGKDNVVADALSRPTAAAVVPVQGGKVSLAELADGQAACQECQQLAKKGEVQLVEVQGRSLWCMGQTGALRPLVPAGMRRAVFNSIHGLAHAGTRATRRMLTARYVWPGCAADVATWCRECTGCARGKPGQREKSPVQQIEIPDRRYSHVHVDLVGPFPAAADGSTHLLTVVDRTTRWPEVQAIRGTTAQVVADAFVQLWVARFGVPAKVTTDRGAQFLSGVWACLCKSLGMKHVKTTAYHPQANGMVERLHRQIKEGLRAREAGTAWLEHLPWVLLGLRAAPKEEAGVSAAEVALGARLELPGPELPEGEREKAIPAALPATHRSWADVVAGPPAALRAADQVMVAREKLTGRPLAAAYTGPFRVLERRSKVFLLQLDGRTDWVSVDRLKAYHGAAEAAG